MTVTKENKKERKVQPNCDKIKSCGCYMFLGRADAVLTPLPLGLILIV